MWVKQKQQEMLAPAVSPVNISGQLLIFSAAPIMQSKSILMIILK